MTPATQSRSLRILSVAEQHDRPEAFVCRWMLGQGADVRAVCRPDEPFAAELSGAGIELAFCPFRSRLDLESILAIRRIVRSWRPDVVHALSSRALANAAWATAGAPATRLVVSCGAMINVRRRNPLARLTYAHPRLERIACISEAVAGHFRRRGFAAGRLTVIHKGVDPAWFTPAPLSRAALGIPDGAAVAVFTGAIRPIKGVPVVLEALRRIPAGHDLHLLLVGARRDPEVERLAAQPDLRPRVHFTGWRRDAASLAGGCDMIVMPTLGNVEGLGKSVLEAMAQGVPAVVSNGGGLIEIVVDGESGLTVPTANVEAWAQALTRLVQDAALRGRLAAGARRRIEEHFHVRRMAEAYLALLSPGAASGP